MSMSKVITLMTDFGTADGYVGTMHGVILKICPEAHIVDISHEIAPQDLCQAAYVLYTAYPYFPDGTVHIVVVDPGVGSERRAIALRTERAVFVAPDNGVLSYVAAREDVLEIVDLTNPRYWLGEISATFHGRDIFSPVGAHLACGVPLSSVGRTLSEIITFDLMEPCTEADGAIRGHVLHVDHFGNIITDIREEILEGMYNARVEIAGHSIEGISTTYAVADVGDLVALIGSEGHLEIAVRDGNAGAALGAVAGDEVVVRPYSIP